MIFRCVVQFAKGKRTRGIDLKPVCPGIFNSRRQQFLSDTLPLKRIIDLCMIYDKTGVAGIYIGHLGQPFSIAFDNERTASAAFDMFDLCHILSSIRPGRYLPSLAEPTRTAISFVLKAMRIFDITVPISDSVPVYDGDPKAHVDTVFSLENGDMANVSAICCGVHTGTHVDAPSHFISGGRTSADIDLGKLVGACRVIQIAESVAEIGPDEISDISGVERILFKTKNSAFWNDADSKFRADYTSLSPKAAQILADKDIKLVGIDYLSIEKFESEDFRTHRILLESEVVILEGLDLRGIEPGDYEMACLPLKYIGGKGDGAPARTILIKR